MRTRFNAQADKRVGALLGVIFVAAGLLFIPYLWVLLTIPPLATFEPIPRTEELKHEWLDSKIREYLRCSVPEPAQQVYLDELPNRSVWVLVSTDPAEIPRIRKAIDPSGWKPGTPSVHIPVPARIRSWWRPPVEDVWVKMEQNGPTNELWVTVDRAGEVYYCRLVGNDESRPQTPQGDAE